MKNLKPFLMCIGGSIAVAVSVVACGSSDDSTSVVPQSDAGEKNDDASVRSDAASPAADSGSSDAGAAIDADVDFCDRVWGSPIAYYDRCCDTTDLLQIDAGIAYYDEIIADCKTQYGNALTSGRLTIDPTKEATCYAAGDANANLACTSVQNPNFFERAQAQAPIQAACRDLYVGNQDVGDSCATSEECKNGLACVEYVYGVSDGYCQEPAASGQACGAGEYDSGFVDFDAFFGTHPDCVSGFTCSFGKCVAQDADGASCFFDDLCVTGEHCISGTCKAPGDLGDACDEDDACLLPLYCDTSNGSPGTCKARNAAGAACDDNTDCLGLCDQPDSGSLGTCKAFCGAP